MIVYTREGRQVDGCKYINENNYDQYGINCLYYCRCRSSSFTTIQKVSKFATFSQIKYI